MKSFFLLLLCLFFFSLASIFPSPLSTPFHKSKSIARTSSSISSSSLMCGCCQCHSVQNFSWRIQNPNCCHIYAKWEQHRLLAFFTPTWNINWKWKKRRWRFCSFFFILRFHRFSLIYNMSLWVFFWLAANIGRKAFMKQQFSKCKIFCTNFQLKFQFRTSARNSMSIITSTHENAVFWNTTIILSDQHISNWHRISLPILQFS